MAGQNITMIGPGAIGAAVGAALIDSGHDVSFASRTAFDVLEVTHPGGRFVSDVECIADPTHGRPSDIVMLAVQAPHTDAARPFLD